MPNNDKTKKPHRKASAGESIALSKMSDSDLSQVASTSSDAGQVAAAKAEQARRKKAKQPQSDRYRRITERNIPKN